MKIKLQPFQDQFLFSEARFPALIAGVGTGKTMMGLLKVWRACEEHVNSLWIVVRKEYTDLRDSTLKDFTRYFSVTADGNKEFRFPNRSTIMFRHGAEINVLKNLTLDGVLIEQAEEFETDEQFQFLRDRLRGTAGPQQQLCLIANANGHNWIWRSWVHAKPSDDYQAWFATSFDNAAHLPSDYVADLRRMETEAPAHYAQYVMNRFDVTDVADKVITADVLDASTRLALPSFGARRRVMGIDVARYGDDETCLSLIESRGLSCWEQVHQECFRDKPTVWTAGKAAELLRTFEVDTVVVDDDGVGGGVTDQLAARNDVQVVPFRGGLPAKDPQHYKNTRTEAAFMVQDLLKKGWLKLLPDLTLHEQALSLRYRYHTDDALLLVSKEEMRRKGLRSPDRFEALMMALYGRTKRGRASHGPSWELEASLATIPENGGISFRP